jgi:hypothetical protein
LAKQNIKGGIMSMLEYYQDQEIEAMANRDNEIDRLEKIAQDKILEDKTKKLIQQQMGIIKSEIIAARDKWFIKTIEDRFGDGHDKPLIQIGVQDWQDFKADKEWVEWVENNMHFCKKPDGAGCSYECNECDHNANYIKWQSRRKEIGL